MSDALTQEKLLARIAELEQRDRERSVDDKIAALSEQWGDNPAFLKKVRHILLSDDGGAALLLSEEGTDEPRKMTVTEVVEDLLDAMPKPVVKLSEQQVNLSHSRNRRPDDTEEPSTEEKASAVVEWLGIGRKQ